jgi:hypothetical protein
MPDSSEHRQSVYQISPSATVPASTTGVEICRLCNQSIGGDYFRVNTLMACPNCAAEARHGQPRDSHVAFSRGLLLGIGGAIVGMAVYAAFTILTGWYIGYLALGVGWLVAKAIKTGSNGLGGRRYQVAAVLLTYAAISMAAVPVGISYAIKHEKAAAKTPHAAAGNTPDAAGPNAFPEAPSPSPKTVPAQWGPLAGQLLLLGLASPFMDFHEPVQGLLGLFILFIGLRVAWRLTASAPLDVEGPFAPVGSAA